MQELPKSFKAKEGIMDLFKSKKEMLLDYIKEKHYVRTSEVIKFASAHFSNRGDRDARLLASEGRIKRISDEEKIFRFNTKEDIWEFIK